MMGSESSLWSTFKRNMAAFGEFDRHEDRLNLGVPDVSYIMLGGIAGGWIELKHVHKPPVRERTIFKIKHFTKEQKFWLRRRGKAGDKCWVLLQVGADYFLYDWKQAQLINTLTWAETQLQARYMWVGRVDWPQLARVLITG